MKTLHRPSNFACLPATNRNGDRLLCWRLTPRQPGSIREVDTGRQTRPGRGTRSGKGDGLLEGAVDGIGPVRRNSKWISGQAPYYIEYRVNEVEDFGAEAAYGALRENQHIHVRVCAWLCASAIQARQLFPAGAGRIQHFAAGRRSDCAAHQIWLATDDAYKAAGQALAEKQAAMKQFSADPNPWMTSRRRQQMIAVEPTFR